MSCNVGYKCTSCLVTSPYWFRDGHQLLKAIYRVWPEFKALLDKIETVGKEAGWALDPTLLGYESFADPEVQEFLTDHYGHMVVACTQFGIEMPLTGG